MQIYEKNNTAQAKYYFSVYILCYALIIRIALTGRNLYLIDFPKASSLGWICLCTFRAIYRDSLMYLCFLNKNTFMLQLQNVKEYAEEIIEWLKIKNVQEEKITDSVFLIHKKGVSLHLCFGISE